MGSITYQSQTSIVDLNTGEETQTTETKTTRLPKEPPYVKLYIDDLCSLIAIPKSLRDILLLIIKKLDYEGYITLSTRYRKEMCKTLGIKDQSLRNALTELSKFDVIKNTGRGEWFANPEYFARGEWADIYDRRNNNEFLKVTLSYDAKGKREISTSFETISPTLKVVNDLK